MKAGGRYPFQDETDELLEQRHRRLMYGPGEVRYPVVLNMGFETWRQRVARRLAAALAWVSRAVGQ